ncbi:hypothetical protein SynM161_00878 [Synechococcus sp. M16.1]|nr:hypothetical protein SynM161_00878 [Synechococcus sp. M16.1]
MFSQHDHLPSRREKLLELLARSGALVEMEVSGGQPLINRLVNLRRARSKEQLEP